MRSQKKKLKHNTKKINEHIIPKDTDNKKDISYWTLNKLKSISNIIDLGVIISIISGLSMICIFIYKITYMNIRGVPFLISLSIIDIKSIDLIITFLLLIILIAIIIMIYCFYPLIKFKTIIFTLIGIFIICKMFKIRTYTSLCIEFNFIILIVSLKFLIKFHKNRPKEITNKILNNSSNIQKIMVASFEIILYIIILCVYSSLMANMYSTIPTDKYIVVNKDSDNKIIIYSSSSELLTAKYNIDDKIDPKKIKINIDSIELVQKGNDPIQLNRIENAIFEKDN
ncbi:hypothetical protein [Clostridium sp. ZS6]|uniref:hypothetical protein n=1 Tax=Clostridium sp. ZS6 TaxID=2949987 RepID=UPI0020796CDD|nr:hypothetical protein [Clostridium sp. ZS6]